MASSTLPTSTQLAIPLLEALSALGGSADNQELEKMIATRLGLSSPAVEALHDPARGKRTEFSYRLAWARTRLKREGSIERVGNRRWRLTSVGESRLGSPR